jgi:monovalent cation:H+ antiporter-2, CPA2 family
MPESDLLVNLALALIAAAIGGAIAARLGQSPILGYIVVGVLIGPFAPGLAEPETVAELADVGLIFLLFGVGLQLSVRELVSVGRVAIFGGTLQIVSLIAIGYFVAVAFGFTSIEAFFFGGFVAMCSTTVLAKLLGERGELGTEHGTVALAWATVQDLATIVLVVLLTGVATGGDAISEVVIAVGKAALFIAVLLPLGARVLPWLFERVALLRSREVFVLSVVAIALGTAFVSEQLGLSLAVGAFLAGLVVSESDISYRALGELTPLRDVFAGIFFVSVGMLFDPAFVIGSLPLVLVALAVVVPIKGAITAGLAYLFRLPLRSAALVGVAMAQAGEFSFLLASLGVELGVVGDEMFSLMLAAAAASIVVSPWLVKATPPSLRWLQRRAGDRLIGLDAPVPDTTGQRGRFVIICGFGRVGRVIGGALEGRGFAYTVIEEDPRIVRDLRTRNVSVVHGSAENARILESAGSRQAQVVVCALPDPVALRMVVSHARRHNPRVHIIARARTTRDRDYLLRHGVQEIVVAETEAAVEMARYTLARLGVSATETAAIVQGLRRRPSGG